MKTIKETISKWNEMYDLVMAGASDADSDTWKRVNEVFMLASGRCEKLQNIINTFTNEWAALTEEDMAEDKGCKVWMKCIGNLLSLSGQDDYAFYIYDGEVGVLCEIDDKDIKAKGYEDYNSIAFIPGYDMESVLGDHLDESPHLTNEDCYSGYCECCDIDVQECRNIENKCCKILDWWSNDWAKSDEFDILFGEDGKYTDELKGRMDSGEIDEQKARKLWEEKKKAYEDPIGCLDYSFDAIFKN